MTNTTKKSLHPLIAIAAGSVILVSLVGVAAMTGMLPNSNGESKADKPNASTALIESSSSTKANSKELAKNATSKTTEHSSARDSFKDSGRDSDKEKLNSAQTTEKAVCQSCGVVTSVRSYEQKAEKGSGVGAVAGAVLGGVIGNQVGGGNGRKIATVAGAVGGSYVGNEIEKSRNSHTVHEVTVKMENGETRTFKPSSRPDWRSGDRVRLVDGRLVSNE
ncbi:glycine zipper 2TM domain-containing protein [Undibacterium danionis]|uniref:Glycine zipper 2TM domain-containing protein n=1 Tax=Undibacterium danionis TaxID=1812100 RepID=A0ABV6IBB9_9BURK